MRCWLLPKIGPHVNRVAERSLRISLSRWLAKRSLKGIHKALFSFLVPVLLLNSMHGISSTYVVLLHLKVHIVIVHVIVHCF